MKKSEIEASIREHVKGNLSPTLKERDFVSSVYAAFKEALGSQCFISGSYARFTASRPLHDLDIIYVSGKFDPARLDPASILSGLKSLLQTNFKNPTSYGVKINSQSHSITVSFYEGDKEIFSVDVVPALTSGETNEYGDDVYWVPEILQVNPRARLARYAVLEKKNKSEVEWWIKSDPRGYIEATKSLNDENSDFRKAVKFIKAWKHACSSREQKFELKSFHVEQILYRIFNENRGFDVFDGIFKFFCDLPDAIVRPVIQDRADKGRFIDDYVGSLSPFQKTLIQKGRDGFLIKLEAIEQVITIGDLLRPDFYSRKGSSEQFLFDMGIPTLLEEEGKLRIQATVLRRPEGGFCERLLDEDGVIEVDRKIEFRERLSGVTVDVFKWKVKNDDKSPQPRGEISNHSTRNDPEHTKYSGRHFVECYAVRKGVCVYRARQRVVLN